MGPVGIGPVGLSSHLCLPRDALDAFDGDCSRDCTALNPNTHKKKVSSKRYLTQPQSHSEGQRIPQCAPSPTYLSWSPTCRSVCRCNPLLVACYPVSPPHPGSLKSQGFRAAQGQISRCHTHSGSEATQCAVGSGCPEPGRTALAGGQVEGVALSVPAPVPSNLDNRATRLSSRPIPIAP